MDNRFKSIDELLQPITDKQLEISPMVNIYEFQKFCIREKIVEDDREYHDKLWDRCKLSEAFFDGVFVIFSYFNEPKNLLQEAINEFLEFYPEFEGEVRFYFDD